MTERQSSDGRPAPLTRGTRGTRVTRVTRAQVREVDRLAIEELGLPGVVLMENAGRGATSLALDLLRQAPRDRHTTLIVCGGGNNGGDGWVVARHLVLHGHAVVCAALQSADNTSGDAAIMRQVVERMELPVIAIEDESALDTARAGMRTDPPALVVDAILGTGFRGTPREPAMGAMRWIDELREAGAKVLALDLPSGLDCDLGQPSEATVRAHRTATFVAEKVGFASPAAQAYLGQGEVVSIGAPGELIERARRAAS